jgi:histidine ammonia-lyase
VFIDGEQRPAAAALAREGVGPYELELEEGLALINGAPLAAALSADVLRRCERLLAQATVIGALTASLMGASWRPYSIRVADAKGDPGQCHVAGELAAFCADDDDFNADELQPPVSLRVLPQVHGAAHDVIAQLRMQVRRELGAVTDSPLYIDATTDESAGFCPTGNLHSQALSLALDSAAIAMTQVAALSEKRLHRLLDARFSGLPEQLAADAASGGSGLVLAAQVRRRPVRREPFAGCPGIDPRRRHVVGPGGLPGVHRPRRQQAGRAARQPGADPGL